MRQFFDSADVQWATANFTLLTALATLVAAFIALIALIVSYRLTRLSIKRAADLAAAKWIFDAHMMLNKDPRLQKVFNEIKWEKYIFSVSPGGDLETNKEWDLNYFLDFLNCVDAALHKRVIRMEELNETTIGFAIKAANRCAPVMRYREFIARRDAELRIEVRAWGAMAR